MNFIKTFLAAILAFVVGSVLVVFLWIFILLGIAGSMEKSVAVHPESILKLDFSEVLTDAPSSDPFAGFDFATLQSTRMLPLMKALRALEAAKDDPRIKGIYLRMNGNGGVAGSALLEELREAIVDFKQSGKFVVAYNETYSQGQYYLASAADRIYMQPEGAMDWSGLSFNLAFYKGLLDKLDVKAEVFRPTACKYKSAVEPYILSKMSDANRRQMQQVVNSLWQTLTEAVSASRGIPVERLNAVADRLEVTLPEEALRHGFVDSLIFEDQMKQVFASYGVKADSRGEYAFISLGDYASQLRSDLKNVSPSEVAIVYADGAIVDGDERDPGSADAQTGASNPCTGFDQQCPHSGAARAETRPRAPQQQGQGGGSPGKLPGRQRSGIGCDLAGNRAAQGRKARRRVDGGLCGQRRLLHFVPGGRDRRRQDDPHRIGVYGMFVDAGKALEDKLGITFDGVRSNPSADMGFMRPLTPVERSVIMRSVDKVYATFTRNVSEGRNLPLTKVLDIAQGRVWSGSDALGIGLIDTYGGLTTAIAIAADKAELGDDYRIAEIFDEPTNLPLLFRMFGAKIRTSFSLSELGEAMQTYGRIQEAVSQQGVVMYCPYRLDLQ